MACSRILVYGYGNPGREDDGLGVAMAHEIESERIPGVAVEMNYQLNVEDAFEIARYDTIVFADASMNDIGCFRFRALGPERGGSFTSHAFSPGSVLALCHELYNKQPRAFVLEIKGFSWEMREGMTGGAKHNLSVALDFLKAILTGAMPLETAVRTAE